MGRFSPIDERKRPWPQSEMSSQVSVRYHKVRHSGGHICDLVKEYPSGYRSIQRYRCDPGLGRIFRWNPAKSDPPKVIDNIVGLRRSVEALEGYGYKLID